MYVTHEIIKPVLASCIRNLKTGWISCTLRSLSQYETTKNKRAEMRMSPNVFRQQKSYKAVVKSVFDASRSIKVLLLHVPEEGFSFKAGQWVDFFAPGIEEVTGYSMTSAPYEARKRGTLELAVKYGKFPPTQWVHNECREGDEVIIQVGGDFHYDPQPGSFDATADLLLIGGGVGVNPLVSILSEYCHAMNASTNEITSARPGKVCVLYSAKTMEELVFMEKFKDMEDQYPSISCAYYITNPGFIPGDMNIKCHRIEENDLKESLKKMRKDKVLCFICGPSTMTDDMANILLKLGISQNLIRYEKWW